MLTAGYDASKDATYGAVLTLQQIIRFYGDIINLLLYLFSYTAILILRPVVRLAHSTWALLAKALSVHM